MESSEQLAVVSVITICYNAVSEIEKTILSVINQTYPGVEYIVIDGGSTDGTVEIIQKYSHHLSFWVSEPDHGIYDAMNKGIGHATGEWIHFLNAGDVYHDHNVLEHFIPKISATTAIAYGDTLYVFSIASKVRKALPLSKMDEFMPIGHPATFVRSDYHKQHLFDTTYKSSGDYKFFYDAYYRDKAEFQYIPYVVADFDAEGGISTSNPFLVKEEDARLRGISHTLKWKLWFNYFKCRYHLSKMVKSLLPKQIQEQMAYRAKMDFIDRL